MANNDLIWIDDVRNPVNYMWIRWMQDRAGINPDEHYIIWVSTFTYFKEYLDKNGLPAIICFDHDLGPDEPSGYDFAKYVVDYCLDHNLDIPKYAIQSSNPVGAENIKSIMDNYHNFTLK